MLYAVLSLNPTLTSPLGTYLSRVMAGWVHVHVLESKKQHWTSILSLERADGAQSMSKVHPSYVRESGAIPG